MSTTNSDRFGRCNRAYYGFATKAVASDKSPKYRQDLTGHGLVNDPVSMAFHFDRADHSRSRRVMRDNRPFACRSFEIIKGAK